MKFVEDHILSFSTAWNVTQSSQYDGAHWKTIILSSHMERQGNNRDHRIVSKTIIMIELEMIDNDKVKLCIKKWKKYQKPAWPILF